jgi:hypothetical protein
LQAGEIVWFSGAGAEGGGLDAQALIDRQTSVRVDIRLFRKVITVVVVRFSYRCAGQ